MCVCVFIIAYLLKPGLDRRDVLCGDGADPGDGLCVVLEDKDHVEGPELELGRDTLKVHKLHVVQREHKALGQVDEARRCRHEEP